MPFIILSALGNVYAVLTAPKSSTRFFVPPDANLFYDTASLACLTTKWDWLARSTAILAAVCGMATNAGAVEPSSLTKIATSSISTYSLIESSSATELSLDGRSPVNSLNKKSSLASLGEMLLLDVGTTETDSSSVRQSILGGLQQVTDNQATLDSRKYRLCHAPTTRKFSDLLLMDTATVYISERGEGIGSEQYTGDVDEVDYDNRENIRQISSHLFFSNPLIGSHWISAKGSYEKISEILCRVSWQNIWVDNSSQKNGPTDLADKDKHIMPQLVQLAGENFIFPHSATSPDLYSVYSPCLFR